MNHRLTTLAGVVLILASPLAARADHEDDRDHEDDAPRFEVTFLFGYNALAGDAGDFFDNGPYAGFGFEYALNKPREKDVYRSFNLRLTGGYMGHDGAFYDVKLEGTHFSLDGVLVFNTNDVVKPYAWLGTGINNVSDDLGVITGSDGIGFSFGGGSKFFFGDHFIALAELGFHDYTVEGDYGDSPAQLRFTQLRFGLGARF